MSAAVLIISGNYLMTQGLVAIAQKDHRNIRFTLSDRIVFNDESFDIVVVDNALITPPGKLTCEKIISHYNSPVILLLSASAPSDLLKPYFEHYLLYSATEHEISSVLSEVLRPSEKEKRSTKSDSVLSERESEVLRYVALGFTNKDISDELCISTHTVITHRKNITAKLGIKTIAGLAVYAVINGIISTEELNK